MANLVTVKGPPVFTHPQSDPGGRLTDRFLEVAPHKVGHPEVPCEARTLGILRVPKYSLYTVYIYIYYTHFLEPLESCFGCKPSQNPSADGGDSS